MVPKPGTAQSALAAKARLPYVRAARVGAPRGMSHAAPILCAATQLAPDVPFGTKWGVQAAKRAGGRGETRGVCRIRLARELAQSSPLCRATHVLQTAREEAAPLRAAEAHAGRSSTLPCVPAAPRWLLQRPAHPASAHHRCRHCGRRRRRLAIAAPLAAPPPATCPSCPVTWASLSSSTWAPLIGGHGSWRRGCNACTGAVSSRRLPSGWHNGCTLQIKPPCAHAAPRGPAGGDLHRIAVPGKGLATCAPGRRRSAGSAAPPAASAADAAEKVGLQAARQRQHQAGGAALGSGGCEGPAANAASVAGRHDCSLQAGVVAQQAQLAPALQLAPCVC